MAVRAATRGTKVPEIRKGDTVVVLAGKDAGKTRQGRPRHPARAGPGRPQHVPARLRRPVA